MVVNGVATKCCCKRFNCLLLLQCMIEQEFEMSLNLDSKQLKYSHIHGAFYYKYCCSLGPYAFILLATY